MSEWRCLVELSEEGEGEVEEKREEEWASLFFIFLRAVSSTEIVKKKKKKRVCMWLNQICTGLLRKDASFVLIDISLWPTSTPRYRCTTSQLSVCLSLLHLCEAKKTKEVEPTCPCSTFRM